MFKFIIVIKCLFTLVANSFQELQTYPLVAYQQNYANHDQPFMTQMVDGYPQFLLQNTWLSYQNIPLTYQDTSKGYYNNFLIDSAPKTFVDTNARIYDQNGYDIMQYISSPRVVNPNVVSNYVNIPQTYLKNQCVDNERQLYFPSELTVNTQGNQHFRKTNDIRPSINYGLNGNDPCQNIERKSKNNNKKRKSYQSKRARNSEENQEKLVKCKPSSKTYKRKKTISDKNKNDVEQNNKCINNANNNSMLKKKINENNILDKKSKTNQRSKYKDQSTTDETVHQQHTGCQSKILNEDNCECLDINENCIELENRRTRNNYNDNPVQTFQQFPNMPKEFNNNMASYINSFMPNQNFNTDLFTTNGNFPFNFDYMNQMPQNSNPKQNGSEKRRRNRRRKKKPKNNRISTNDNDRSSKNNNEISNKNQQIEDNKVVELLPNKPVEIKLKTKLIPAAPVQVVDIVPEKNLTKVNVEADILPDKDEDPIEVILEPTSVIINTHDQNVHLPVSQEYTLNVYDNDIFDDYYPDFTSDNIYLSKEDQDYNFHDRHYYNADKKTEISRERRKYEPSVRQNHKINRIDTLVSDESVDNSIKKVKKLASIEEIKFKTPPGLDFPDFKTEMINKDKYNLRSDINYPSNKYQNQQSDKVSSFSRVKSIEPHPEDNVDDAVETIFARTKVAKYGVPETDEKTNQNFGEFNHTDKPTNDEKTTIVLAKSLNYPIGYK